MPLYEKKYEYQEIRVNTNEDINKIIADYNSFYNLPVYLLRGFFLVRLDVPRRVCADEDIIHHPPQDGMPAVGNILLQHQDLSSSIDITAFVLVFPPRNDTEKYILLPYFWIPEENMRLRVRRDHVPYDVWEKQGFLHTTEGNVIHYGFIENFIDDLGKKFHIKEIAFDRWGAVQMVQNLEGLGFTVVPFGQGFKDMSPPTKRLMELVLEKNIAHGGHPVLRWMMDNIFVRTDPAGNIKPDKEKSTEKIDGAVATIMGLDRAIRNSGISTGSVYDERGILSL